MPNRSLAVLLSAAFLLSGACDHSPQLSTPKRASATATSDVPSQAASVGRADEVDAVNLPHEARYTLQLIKRGGPFPYTKDGTVFGNREGLLPAEPRGYYHEYTVQTPGERDRGARRIIAGRNGEFYYTDDHYRSFRRIRE